MLTKASFTDGLIAVAMNMIGIAITNEAGGKRYTLTKAMLNVFAAFTDVGVNTVSHI